MRLLQHSMALVVALAVASTACADLAAPSGASCGAPPGVGVEAPPLKSNARLSPRALTSLFGESAFGLPASVPDAPAPPAQTMGVGELPPSPDSATLCVSALAGFGLWQLGRSARKLHWGALPDWYHTAGPVQVGHATPLDLEFSLAALPACVFDAPVVASRPACLSERLRDEPYKRLLSQTILLSADPRGPPTL